MIIKTNFKDLFILKNKSFKDKRGYFKELIKEKKIKKKLPFTVMSYSKKNVIRGLHIQTKKPQGKFISVLKGKVYDVAIDLRKNSKTFCKVFSCILSEKKSQSIYIPPGFAHGFCGLDKENFIIYSCTQYRDLSNKDLGKLITKGTVYVECHMTVAKIKKMIAQAENRKAFFKEHK